MISAKTFPGFFFNTFHVKSKNICFCNFDFFVMSETLLPAEGSVRFCDEKCVLLDPTDVYFSSVFLQDVVFLFPSEQSETSLPAHRLILSIKSLRFQSFFEQLDANTPLSSIQLPIEINVNDISFTLFSIFIQFLYTDNLQLVQERIQAHSDSLVGPWKALARVSCLYLVPQLVRFAMERLAGLLDLHNFDQTPGEDTLEMLIFTSELEDCIITNGAMDPISCKVDEKGDTLAEAQCIAAIRSVKDICLKHLVQAEDTILCRILSSSLAKRWGCKGVREILCQRSSAPLVLAVRYQLEHIVIDLLRSGESCDKKMDEELPLSAALKTGNEKIIRLLLAGHDAPMLLLNDRTPHLLLACYKGNSTHCEILLRSSNNDSNWISTLTTNEANAASILGKGQTPLHIASRYNHTQSLSLLIQHGAIANLQDDEGNTPLHYVNSIECAQILLQVGHKTNPNIPNKRGRVPLHEAAAQGRVEIADLLMSRGANQDVMDDQSHTPFLAAALNGHASMLLFLLRQVEMAREDATLPGDGTTNSESNEINTEKDYSGDSDKYLFINQYDMKGNSALHLASMSPSERCPKVLLLLLENGANPNIKNWFGYTPLHMFCSHQHGPPSIIEAFIEQGADVHAQSGDLSTALHLAVAFKSTDVVVALVKAGAMIHARDAAGRDVLDLTSSLEEEMSELILQHITKQPTWISNDQVAECSCCQIPFGIALRKHHCRHCGRIICHKCSGHQIPLPKFGIDDVSRVCDTCFNVLQKGENFSSRRQSEYQVGGNDPVKE
uniref:Myosinlike protein putative n=1 Tax=Albugo laibachii Nc14 TaxID=890382 RepID=F0WNN9_9STRA|nr:myosinlike protein putative [Albugo laibachii Nc14]|eukprot:CCA22930.1 myosinlike protein putative [Albugo laibachii Nc14]